MPQWPDDATAGAKPPFPSPTLPRSSRRDVFLGYLDYFRETVVEKVTGLSEEELRSSRLPSGWTPLELVWHLTHVERRWLVWGVEGEPVADPWGDERGGPLTQHRWYVHPELSTAALIEGLRAQGEVTRSVVQRHDLADVGRPGPRWDGAEPATVERVLFHLLQEYARHVGHLDIVRELADEQVGE